MNLFSTEEPLVTTLSATAAELDVQIKRWRAAAGESCAVYILRGWRMTDWPGLYSEFQATMQFPDYFGKNWAALDDCLSDLDWISTKAILLIFVEAPSILRLATPEDRSAFVQLLVRISHEWSMRRPIGVGMHAEARPFHVVFQAQPEDAAKLSQIAEMAVM